MAVSSDPARLARDIVAGDRRALARTISLVEDGRPEGTSLVSDLYAHGGSAHVIGITGSPGAGKSSLTDRLITLIREDHDAVAVVAVDPASPFTGGALLGDRVRMQNHASDPGVFIRSMSNRGHLGGLADATTRVLTVLDAAGFDPILVETVGVGQSEIEVVEAVDTTIVAFSPGWGDGVQAAKAGILEIGDIFVVNKADLPGADEIVRELIQMLELGPRSGDWRIPVVRASSRSGEGIDRLWDEIQAHRIHLTHGEGLAGVHRRRALSQLRAAATARAVLRVNAAHIDPSIVDAVAARRLDPWSAAQRLS